MVLSGYSDMVLHRDWDRDIIWAWEGHNMVGKRSLLHVRSGLAVHGCIWAMALWIIFKAIWKGIDRHRRREATIHNPS